MGEEGHRVEYRDLLGGNFSIRRELFRKIGGFPADFARADGEDWELGIRLVESAVPIRFLPEASAEHRDDETMTLERSFVRARRSGRGDARVRRLHPDFGRKLGPPPGRPGTSPPAPGSLQRQALTRRPHRQACLSCLAPSTAFECAELERL
jgi:hypothetical protein